MATNRNLLREAERISALARSPVAEELAKSTVLIQVADFQRQAAASVILPVASQLQRQFAASTAVKGLVNYQSKLISDSVAGPRFGEVQKQLLASSVMQQFSALHSNLVKAFSVTQEVEAHQRIYSAQVLKLVADIQTWWSSIDPVWVG